MTFHVQRWHVLIILSCLLYHITSHRLTICHPISLCFPRNWPEYSQGAAFDLHLLRWETALQLNIGKSIVSAWVELGKTAAQVISMEYSAMKYHFSDNKMSLVVLIDAVSIHADMLYPPTPTPLLSSPLTAIQYYSTILQDAVIKTFFSALSLAALLPTLALTLTNMVNTRESLLVLCNCILSHSIY